ncbi:MULTISPECIES: pilus assembly protein N-terminal domain-containing protein [unclassified Bradyrhizobium]|uniref:pilus assembly protein N-terminal domain-containing protein n=1 Tax=Bradyrhizobium sp. USDA 4541 TaxID=2817704 RepID=UPI0020A4A14C|nr:pilus assembly protein N-terminal domain-containing protein [Bradyrhizobium sp. USDA 4541]MCP1850180.1 hypothetical protein [Bradyrhizobium sp. USDA 4541]
MKRFALLSVFMLLCEAALAQPPVEVTSDDTIELAPGQTKVVSFDHSISEIKVAAGETIAKIRPMTDRTFVIEGAGSGETLAIAYGAGGREIHRFNISVAGHLVKVYGQKPPITGVGKPGQEHDSYLCTGTLVAGASIRISPQEARLPSSSPIPIKTRTVTPAALPRNIAKLW